MHISELETPALLVDLDRLHSNLRGMADFFNGTSVRLRPHFKNHRCLTLARWQIEAGAIGITCATLAEAECLVNGGINGVLIANEIASSSKLERVAELSARSEVILAVDNAAVVAKLAECSHRLNVPVNVLLDIDIGLHRCGIEAGTRAVDLARAIAESGLHLRGVMGYEGHLLRQGQSPEKTNAAEAAMHLLLSTKERIEDAGIPLEIVSVGGTGSYDTSGRYPGVTELQAGSYLLMETDYAAVCPAFKPAISVLTTVISKTEGERIVLDAGIKELSCERGLPGPKDLPGVTTDRINAEHTILSLDSGHRGPEIGSQVEMWVRYGDGTVNLHRRMFGIRHGSVEEVFEICGGTDS